LIGQFPFGLLKNFHEIKVKKVLKLRTLTPSFQGSNPCSAGSESLTKWFVRDFFVPKIQYLCGFALFGETYSEPKLTGCCFYLKRNFYCIFLEFYAFCEWIGQFIGQLYSRVRTMKKILLGTKTVIWIV